MTCVGEGRVATHTHAELNARSVHRKPREHALLLSALPSPRQDAGFSTFRFEDFVDGRVRPIVPTVRGIMLRSMSTALFGMSWEAVLSASGVADGPSFVAMYNAHAQRLRKRDNLLEDVLNALPKPSWGPFAPLVGAPPPPPPAPQ